MQTSTKKDFTEYRAIAIPLQSSGSITKSSNHNEYQKQFFVGRKNITEKLVDLLQSTRQSGSYLIAGYRGSGKTSMVDKALELVAKKNEKEKKNINIYEVRINLGDNSQLTPLNIYYSIANILRNTIADGNNGPKSLPPPMWKRILKWMRKEPSVKLRDISIGSVFLACIASPILLFNPETIFITSDFFTWKLIPILLPLTALGWIGLYLLNYDEIKALRDIDELIERMSYEITEERNATLKHGSSIGFSNSIGFSKHKKRLPIKTREAEEQLIRILHQDGLFKNAKVVIVMDEIDKLSDDEELSEIHHHDKSSTQESDKSSKINTLLGSLKNFITTAPVTFFFISGRETLDRYYSEKGSPNSLYGSLFDQVFEIPSLLSDKGELSARNTQLYAGVAEYVCRRIRKNLEKEEEEENNSYYTLEKYRESFHAPDISPGEIRYGIAILMNFIFYLTFHSWGNPKKLSSIFESFIYPYELVKKLEKKEKLLLILDDKDSGKDDKPKQWLVFNVNHLRSFSLASEITTLFQHHLSREVSQISDKLTVSSFSSLHFILKLHSYGFKRESLHLMSEAINVYRSPELNTIVDDLLTNIFKSYIRRVRNGLYRYRFHSGFEQELRYISHVSGLESASFNFSLDSMRYVKRFFEVILANTNSSETDVISRSHISLGDMCTIEQSYNAASIHYHTASRILANTLKEEGASINQETLMQYIEVLLKHGDLEERRQNYNHAAAIYSEADHIVQSLSNDKELSLHLQSGDSKWDLLKLPFWAGLYLDLKRSPRPYKKYIAHKNKKIQPPEHLYRLEDQRFHYRAASLHFFLGEAESAIESYETTLAYAEPNKDSKLYTFDERNAYMLGNAQVGKVESTLVLKSRALFEILINPACEPSDAEELKKKNIIYTSDERKELREREREKNFLKGLFDLISTTNELILGSSTDENSLFDEAAGNFEKNRLYISAAMTHIKAIYYTTSLLDFFDYDFFNNTNLAYACKSESNEKAVNYRQLKDEIINNLYPKLKKRAKKAIICINKARQLESNQSNKTMLAYDYLGNWLGPDVTRISDLFEMLLEPNEKTKILEEGIFWQHSLWTHKLASSLFWADYVKRKTEKSDFHSANDAIPLPKDLSMLSVRSTIVMRWTHARNLCRQHIDKNLVEIKQKAANNYKLFIPSRYINEPYGPCSTLNILKSLIEDKDKDKIKLSIHGVLLIEYIKHKYKKKESETSDQGAPNTDDLPIPKVLRMAYEVSRHLHLAQESSRIISRKNLDLIFPRSPQLYLAQWKLLSNFTSTILMNREKITEDTKIKLDTVRDISFFLQKIFLDIENEMSFEKIPPSHFDYEHVYTRLRESLDSSISLIDRNSRTHMGIFEYKYFCHDDHNDPEFRMDYTLAYMFTPLAMYWQNEAREIHEKFVKIVTKEIEHSATSREN